MREEKVFINGKVALGTTITHVDDNTKSPAIVIIMGTGTLDRDGNGIGIKTNMYKNLAEEFAKLGFVSLRYDKRGTHKSGGKNLSTGLFDLVDDAVSVIKYAKTLSYIDENKVIVCGHSEGGIIAALLSDREETAGLMILGAAGCNLKDALYYQNRLVSKELSEMKGILGFLLRNQASEEKNIAKVDKLFDKCSSSDKDVIFFGGAKIQAKWIREHNSFSSDKMIEMLKAYKKPVLAITGTADLSADYRCLEALENDSNIETYAPEKVNHILREIDNDNSMLKVKKQYMRLSKNPIHKETLGVISNWLHENFG